MMNLVFGSYAENEKRSVNNWSFKTFANTGDTLLFKFTRGDWNTEAVDSNGIEFPNFMHCG